MLFARKRENSYGETSFSEMGSTEALLTLIPTCLLVVTLFALIQYGSITNSLVSASTLVGRQVARYPEAYDLEKLTAEQLQQNEISVSDFHVMRIVLGKSVFVQTILVGKRVNFGPFSMVPSGRSLTFVDSWS